MAEHLRETYNIPGNFEIGIGEFKGSDVAGFDVADVSLSRGRYKQAERLYLSKDGRHYLLGSFRDLKANPDQERLAKMDLKSSAYRGRAKAPVVIVQYTDFQCPYCQLGYQLMRDKIMKEYPKNVRWIYKALPLNSIHPWAEPAAIAVECAREQGDEKFWAMHDALFDGQRELTTANFGEKVKGLAEKSRVEVKPFLACFDGKKTLPAVQRDAAEAESLNVNSTPSFFVNGHMVSSGADYGAIKETIEEALKGKHGKP